MHRAVILFAALAATACSGSSAAPSDFSVGATTDIAGAWTGTFASSNNATAQIALNLSQSAGNVTGGWSATSVSWSGQITGTVSGTSFSGQLAFTGTAADNTICNGTATLAGSVSTTTLSWTSASGVTGAACPAPLPAAIRIDLHR
jgi:hypothetical protein